jgi:ATP-dependent DNA helicase RecG
MAKLSDELIIIKGIGQVLADKLASIGIKDIAGLIDYYPRRYDDYSVLTPIARLKPGAVSIRAEIKQAKGRYVRRGLHVTEAVASDETSSVRLVWFNQPYRAAALKPGVPYYISGQFEFGRGRLAIMNPTVELVSEFPLNTARIVPIYKETKGLTSRQIRRAVSEVRPLIAELPETLPDWLLKSYDLIGRSEATEAIHFPANTANLLAARRRIGFEEVFSLVLASLMNKADVKDEPSLPVKFEPELAREFVSGLPFKLTDDQRVAVMRIYMDLERPQPMNRLVEGDVGSGKTVVAAMGSLMALAQGYQVVLMAPTEILARQHADTIYKLLKPLKMADSVSLLVGSLSPAAKARAHQAISSGQAAFIIGTHAVIADAVDIHKLALVIIDEQHRFGVNQRKALMSKAGHMPHVLSLSATPIPRSLALTVFGELDISRLQTMPSGRAPVTTKLVVPGSRLRLYSKIDKELERGRQMFVVTPQITENGDPSVSSAEEVYKTLKSSSFKHRRIGLLHGRQKPSEKNRIMEQFVAGDLDILVSTTVIEVGVDVPNATIMVVESAERFGLAQLHQLRGRVGRGQYPGSCYLMLSKSSAPTQRLKALESSTDGFELAELDLKLRGPGAIYGTLQHGVLDLRIAELSDTELIRSAVRAAREFMEKDNLLNYSQLTKRITKLRLVTNLN